MVDRPSPETSRFRIVRCAIPGNAEWGNASGRLKPFTHRHGSANNRQENVAAIKLSQARMSEHLVRPLLSRLKAAQGRKRSPGIGIPGYNAAAIPPIAIAAQSFPRMRVNGKDRSHFSQGALTPPVATGRFPAHRKWECWHAGSGTCLDRATCKPGQVGIPKASTATLLPFFFLAPIRFPLAYL